MSKDSKIYFRQLIVIGLLVLVPVVMIFINGKSALEGILWKRDASVETLNQATNDFPPIRFGYYDPAQSWQKDEPWEVELLYISWLHFDKDSLKQQLEAITNKGLKAFLTVEPWNRDEDENLLKSITLGKYDSEIADLKYAFKNLKDTLYISWGHEMDQDLTERYSWSDKDPDDFINAYRYFHGNFDTEEFKIKWIWSPVAKETSPDYWPGDDYVDGIGVPVYAFPAWDVLQYGYVRKFEETFNEKYAIVKRFNKPVIIKEFGVSGPEYFKREWFEHAFTQFKNYPLLNTVLFFNSEDTPGVWGGNISTPDWRLDENLALELVENYQLKNHP
jgi:endoglucanase